MDFLYLKALHIIFVVSWFAGILYFPRLLVHQTEADKKPEPEKSILQKQMKKMTKPLWYGITWPAMLLSYTFGTWMVCQNPSYYLKEPWFILKLAFVFGFTLYHFKCHMMFRNYQKDIISHTSIFLRIWNEIATVFLVAIVFIVVTKDHLSWIWGLIGLLLFVLMLMGAIFIYKRAREKKTPSAVSKPEKED